MAQAVSNWAAKKLEELNDWLHEPDAHVKAVKKAAWERALWETHPGKVAKAEKGQS